jgi:hypothetical protein
VETLHNFHSVYHFFHLCVLFPFPQMFFLSWHGILAVSMRRGVTRLQRIMTDAAPSASSGNTVMGKFCFLFRLASADIVASFVAATPELMNDVKRTRQPCFWMDRLCEEQHLSRNCRAKNCLGAVLHQRNVSAYLFSFKEMQFS